MIPPPPVAPGLAPDLLETTGAFPADQPTILEESTMPRHSDDRDLLLQIVEECYHRATWNGTNLAASLRRVDAGEAGWRPPGGKRTIAQIALHCAYWKYALRRRLNGDRRGSFPLGGTNWFRTPRLITDLRWAEYRQLLDHEHEQLCEAIRGRSLRFDVATSRATVRRVFGVAMHDAYHTGQIKLVRALYRNSRLG